MKYFCKICKKEKMGGYDGEPCNLTRDCSGKMVPLSLIFGTDYNNFNTYFPEKITKTMYKGEEYILPNEIEITGKKIKSIHKGEEYILPDKVKIMKSIANENSERRRKKVDPIAALKETDFERKVVYEQSLDGKNLLNSLRIDNPIHASQPNLVHFIWFGRVLPITYLCNIADFLSLNPEYTAIVWTSDVQTMSEYVSHVPWKREQAGKTMGITQPGLRNDLVLLPSKKSLSYLDLAYTARQSTPMSDGLMKDYKMLMSKEAVYADKVELNKSFPDGVQQFKKLYRNGRIKILSVLDLDDNINKAFVETKIDKTQYNAIRELYDLSLNLIGGPNKHFAMASDILRLILILTKGGLYLDTDTYFHPKMKEANKLIRNKDSKISLVLGSKYASATYTAYNAIMYGPQYSRGALMMLEFMYNKLRKSVNYGRLSEVLIKKDLNPQFVLDNTGPSLYEQYLSLVGDEGVIATNEFAIIESDKTWK
ncbi:glycosyltransferase [Allofrancisella frigidaquae]|uniref:Uncharacterized protein n=1 Tax=Allofrancisella frigidaquae TaxID=1085644 RepID=A0A6M3HTK8_9GAMM|nr:glycosyltransferase [Allofrancisella frigidaquae]QIV94370.1 hypothetical protein E3E15_02945 [Allofrancisella frigidaquae]